MLQRKRKAFTLIELMVVIAILAVLAAIMLPRFIRVRFQSYLSACVQNEHNIATAIESYSVDNLNYPPSLTVLPLAGARYISALPVCPADPSLQYQSGYEVASAPNRFTLSCPGPHFRQLPGAVSANYPQYSSTGILTTQ